jgi:hypothetical protein
LRQKFWISFNSEISPRSITEAITLATEEWARCSDLRNRSAKDADWASAHPLITPQFRNPCTKTREEIEDPPDKKTHGSLADRGEYGVDRVAAKVGE